MQGPLSRRAAKAVVLALAAALAAPPAAAQGAPQIRFTVAAFRVEGDNPLSAAHTRSLLAPYLGEQRGLTGIQAAAKALEDELIERGYSFHRVVVPPQRAAGGEFRLQVVAFRIATVEVNGASHFSESNVRASLPAVAKGVAPNTREVARGLLVANEHGAKQVAVFVREREETPGELVARIDVRDTKPWRVFASAANTGDDRTGRVRLSLGAQHSNLFDADHGLTVSYTTAPGHYGEVKQRGLFYSVPLYGLATRLSAYYASSDVDQGTVDNLDISGSGNFKGLRAVHALLPRGNYSDRLELALEDRLFDNRVVPSLATQSFFPPVRSRPLSLRYSARWETDQALVSGHVEATRNLTSGRNNTVAAYQANLATGPNWAKLGAVLDADYRTLSRYRLHARFEAQYAFDRLISGERFGLGGTGSVRGFEEREVPGDSGYLLSAEAWLPPLDWGVSLVGFLDLGLIHLRDQAFAERDFLAGAGLGVRWQWQGWLSLSADLARVLDGNRNALPGTDTTRTGDYKLHFALLARY